MNRNEALHDNSTVHILSGLAQLHTSISFEYSTGLQHLPSVYCRYFSTPLPIILKKSVSYKKRWFLVIRSARESSGLSTYNDIWHQDQALRIWIGFCPSNHHHSLAHPPTSSLRYLPPLHILHISFIYIFLYVISCMAKLHMFTPIYSVIS